MFAMPKKADIKKATLRPDDEETYTLTLTTPLLDEGEFNRIINEDIVICLSNAGGSLIDSSWETKSIKVKMQDIRSFQVCLSRRYYFIERRL